MRFEATETDAGKRLDSWVAEDHGDRGAELKATFIHELGKIALQNSWSCWRKYEILGARGLEVTNGPELDEICF